MSVLSLSLSLSEPHTMTVNVLEAQADGVLGGGNAQLSLDPYHSLGFTLKNSSGHYCVGIRD